MAKIAVLPVRFGRPDQTNRLNAELAAAYERGLDLGSRIPHIRAGGEQLRELGYALEVALNELAQLSPEPEWQDLVASPGVRQLLDTIRVLADKARRIP